MPQMEAITRARLDSSKVDHFLDFISRPNFVQDVAYGTKTLKLSNGEKMEIPNVVRTVIASRIVDLYQQYCQETGFLSHGRSTLFSILQVRIKTKSRFKIRRRAKKEGKIGVFYILLSHVDITKISLYALIVSCFLV